ncbi:MAG TPA: RNA polymerase sigma factor [Gemmatimonadales bacterium]|nr:RNA polymerase sigma factor [Gemmatimonadales bacterium]
MDARQSEEIRRAVAGDADAFGRLYRAHVGRVYAVCLRLEGDAARAEELTQDVFVRAWEALPGFRGESAFGTWLHRLAVNVVLGDRRAAWRRDRRVLAVEEPEALERPRELDPALALDLEDAIASLPPGARAVFVLHDMEGYQHAEIAAMTGIAEGTSKAQLFRARRLLRERLAP